MTVTWAGFPVSASPSIIAQRAACSAFLRLRRIHSSAHEAGDDLARLPDAPGEAAGKGRRNRCSGRGKRCGSAGCGRGAIDGAGSPGGKGVNRALVEGVGISSTPIGTRVTSFSLRPTELSLQQRVVGTGALDVADPFAGELLHQSLFARTTEVVIWRCRRCRFRPALQQ